MVDFEVQRCTRKCAASQRELKPGDSFYSELVPNGAEIVRRDYSVDAWQGPAEDAIAFWKSEMPDPSTAKLHWAPNDVMLNYFLQLDGLADRQDTRYVLTLLMIRRRVVRFEETEHDENGKQVLVVYCPRNETEYKVAVAEPDLQRAEEIQEELAKLLFGAAA